MRMDIRNHVRLHMSNGDVWATFRCMGHSFSANLSSIAEARMFVEALKTEFGTTLDDLWNTPWVEDQYPTPVPVPPAGPDPEAVFNEMVLRRFTDRASAAKSAAAELRAKAQEAEAEAAGITVARDILEYEFGLRSRRKKEGKQ